MDDTMSGESKQEERKEITRKRMQIVQKRNEEPQKDTIMEREMTREEKDEKGRMCMEIMRKKNEEFKRRYAEVQQDRKSAEDAQSSVTLQFRASASSKEDKEDKEEEIVKPQVHTREWDKHKTCDSAWEPPEDWKSFEHRSNFPDRRYDRTKDYADKRGTYARQDRRYQNNFNSTETKPKFVRNSDDASRRSDNFGFRQTNNNQNYIARGRGRGRGLKPRMYEQVSHEEDNVRSSSFNRASSGSSHRSNTLQNTASTNFERKPYSGWSNSSIENDNDDKRKFDAGVCNKSQTFKKQLTPTGTNSASYVSENKVTGGNWSDGSDNDSKVEPNFDKKTTSISKEKRESDTWSELKKQSSSNENPFSTTTKSSWLGSSRKDDYKPRTDIYMKSASTSKKSFNEIRSNNKSQIFEKRPLSITVCDANRRRVVQSSGSKLLNTKDETTKIKSRIEHKTDEWADLNKCQFKLKENNSKTTDSGTWSDTEELPEKSQQFDGWSDVEVTSDKLEICDSIWIDSPVDVLKDIDKKCGENVINKQDFSETGSNVECTSSDVPKQKDYAKSNVQDHKNCADTKETLNDDSDIADKKDVYKPNKNSRGPDSLSEAKSISEISTENVSDIFIESSNSCSISTGQFDVENASVSTSNISLNPNCDKTGFDVKNTSDYNLEQAEVTSLYVENYAKCGTTICTVKDECDISQNNYEIVFDNKSVSNKNDETRLDVDSPSVSIPKHKDDANVENNQKCDSLKSDIKHTLDISQTNDIAYDKQDNTPESKKNSKCSDSLDETKGINETLIGNEKISDMIENRVSDSDPQIPTEQLDKIGDIINCLNHKLYVCDSSSDCLPDNSVVDSKRTMNVTGTDCDNKCDDANDDSWDTYSEGTGSDD